MWRRVRGGAAGSSLQMPWNGLFAPPPLALMTKSLWPHVTLHPHIFVAEIRLLSLIVPDPSLPVFRTCHGLCSKSSNFKLENFKKVIIHHTPLALRRRRRRRRCRCRCRCRRRCCYDRWMRQFGLGLAICISSSSRPPSPPPASATCRRSAKEQRPPSTTSQNFERATHRRTEDERKRE